jgi:hypothetical protein
MTTAQLPGIVPGPPEGFGSIRIEHGESWIPAPGGFHAPGNSGERTEHRGNRRTSTQGRKRPPAPADPGITNERTT